MIKTLVKLLGGLAVGFIIGLLLAGVGLVCFTDTTMSEFIDKLTSVVFKEAMLAACVAVIAFAVSMMILIPIHEAGHLVCGLLSGYTFVSFRIFNFTFIRSEGKLTIKRYGIAGTGGQCLLTPPERPLDRIPTAWYNAGGVLANLIAVAAMIPLMLSDVHPFVKEASAIFVLSGALLILTNGIPMKISGAGNDAYNILALRRNLLAKRGFIESLKAYALLQDGTRPKDMPDEWFVVPENINYADQLEASIPLMAASRLIDRMDYTAALKAFKELYAHKKAIIGLFVKEIECELVFLRLVCGDTEGAKELLTDSLRKYIDSYRRMMSSKERILCAVALVMDNDRERAVEIHDTLKQRQGDYLLQGEVKSDIAVMEDVLTCKGEVDRNAV